MPLGCGSSPTDSDSGNNMHQRRSSCGMESGGEMLLDAVCKGKLHLARFILEALDNSSDIVNTSDMHGKTPLIRACRIREQRCRAKIVDLLVKRGAKVNLQDRVGRTALHYACELHANDLVKIFVKFGADPNIPDNDGCTALILCARHGNDIGTEILVRCYRRLGLNVDSIDSEGVTALMTAMKFGYLECASVLLHRGKASLELRDKINNYNAEDWALENGVSSEEFDNLLVKPVIEEAHGISANRIRKLNTRSSIDELNAFTDLMSDEDLEVSRPFAYNQLIDTSQPSTDKFDAHSTTTDVSFLSNS